MNFNNRIVKIILFLFALWLIFDLISYLGAEILWFQEVDYLWVFWGRLVTQWILIAFTLIVISGFWLGNLALANRLKHNFIKNQSRDITSEKTTHNFRNILLLKSQINPGSPIKLPWLLPMVIISSLSISLILLYYGKIALRYWHIGLKSPNILPNLPMQFGLESLPKILTELLSNWWQLGSALTLTIVLLIFPKFFLNVLAVLISLCLTLIISNQWPKFLQFFHPVAFNITDPVFDKDLSFYIFSLPILQIIEFAATGLFLYGLISCTLLYLLSGNSLSEGIFIGFSQPQQRHLCGLGGMVMLTVAFQCWLSRYELLYSQDGVIYGASYTDVTVKLPGYTILSILAGIIAVLLFYDVIKLTIKYGKLKPIFLAFFSLNLIVNLVLPKLVQVIGVQPNELAREEIYIERSIAFTKQAFDLKRVEVKTFEPEGKLTYKDLEKNQLTISNIRLWDKRPLLQTNRQLQQIRPYYKFLDADIDRYIFRQNKQENSDSEKQQVIIAARELDYTLVPQKAQTWVNKNLVYTHGYGFTLSPVNTVGDGGLPNYFVKDIAINNEAEKISDLGVANEAIMASIPINKPRIYYGEITDTEVMIKTKVKEFDYPSGDENVYNTYDGSGGIPIGSLWRRLIFAKYLNNWQMAFTNNFTPETKVLFRRNIKERVRAIAPFLYYDSDPYLVAANANNNSENPEEQPETSGKESYLYWIIDAYTVSDRYPYSDPGQNQFNYIRNSVKVVIDAYNGSVNFYVSSKSDPIINSWIAIFPDLFKPIDQMPASIRSHIRYPVDLFSIQSERLLTYHMEDPQVFYNREDLWRIPNEIYGNEQQPVKPYYLIMKLPTETSEEFILLLPFTPASRNNLIAWLAARSDGENYGKLLLYQFPKQRLVYGPEQIEALINQEPAISEQISLWTRQGSKAVQGNLLVVPIAESLLYVEPIYLEATDNSLPTLVRVIVSYENKIVMGETLDEALKAIFFSKPTKKSTIVRPVNGTNPSLQ